MRNSIYTYSLMKALFDEGDDYLDSFLPFVVRATPKDTSWTAVAIQDTMRKNFDLNMPLHVLSVILQRVEKKNYVSKVNDTYRLTENGFTYVSKMETNKEVERRINQLCVSIQDFCTQKNVNLTNKQTRDLLTNFVHKNIEYFAQYVNPTIGPRPSLPITDGNERCLMEYFEIADKQEPENYRTLEDMVMGSVLSVLLCAQTPEDLQSIKESEFNSCTLFLDTNFVFSVMGLHSREFNDAASELYNLLIEHKFNLKVFSFTVEEISRVVNAYCSEGYRYPTNLKVYTLYSALKRKGWKETEAREFIMYIEKNLQDKKIAVEWTKDVTLDNYKPADEERQGIRHFKPEQSVPHQNHDLLAIKKVGELREHPATRLEDSKVLFLTSDARLSRFNYETCHKQTKTVCEVVLDRLLTNVLWLKNPRTKLSLKAIIASHSHELFIKRNVWNKFYDVLQDLKVTGKTTDDKIATLFLHSYIEDSLLSVENTDSITEDFVLDHIEKAQKQAESVFNSLEQEIAKVVESGKEKDAALETKKKELENNKEELRKEKEFAKNLVQTAVEKEREDTNKKWLKQIESIKDEIRKKSDRTASLITKAFVVTAIAAYVFILSLAYFWLNVPLTVLSFGLSAGGFGGLFGIWKAARKAKPKIFSYIFDRKMSNSELKNLGLDSNK